MIAGVGVGLRTQHYAEFLNKKNRPDIPWLEIISDNYMFTQGVVMDKLLAIREHYPMVMHGIGLNIGSVDPLNMNYLKALKALKQTVQAEWISDHLCWTGAHSIHSHDLLPLPYTEEALNHMVSRIHTVQDYLGEPLVLENVSSYVQLDNTKYTEVDFLNEMVKRSGCSLLLDINNIVVNANNHGFSAEDFLKTIHINTVKQFHLGGYEGTELFVDTHGAAVHDEVWTLYKKALERFGNIPTLIEWDNNIPSFSVLKEEVKKANYFLLNSIGE